LIFKIFNIFAVNPKYVVKKGATVLLVGIHNHNTVTKFIELVGKKGLVIVVEASPHSYNNVMTKIMSDSKVSNVIFKNLAAYN